MEICDIGKGQSSGTNTRKNTKEKWLFESRTNTEKEKMPKVGEKERCHFSRVSRTARRDRRSLYRDQCRNRGNSRMGRLESVKKIRNMRNISCKDELLKNQIVWTNRCRRY